MTATDSNSFEIHLANAEGIPVVRVGGSITRTAVRALRSTLRMLARAGHYNIVLNIERVDSANWQFLGQLEDAVAEIRSHYGAVSLVAADAVRKLAGARGAATLFRVCASERDAISRIKRLNRPLDGIANINARFMEQS